MPKRRVLSEISGNAIHRKELSPATRGKIIGKAEEGASQRKISRDLTIAKSTIADTIKHAPERQHQQSKKRLGRPTKWNTRDERRILRIVRKSPKREWKDVLNDLDRQFSKRTLQRVLRKHNITKWRAAKRPKLTPEHARARLKFARRYIKLGWWKWKKVIFSDEYSVERGAGKKRVWVFRTPQQRYDPDKIELYYKGKDKSIMVLAAFSGYSERADLVVMERDPDAPRGGYSARSYISALEPIFDQIWEPGMLFMHDNAGIYSARLTQEWLRNRGVELLPLPPYSPDLNPTEHLFPHLKTGVYRVKPDIDDVRGDQQIIDTIREVLLQAWDRIKEVILWNC
jgi:transposase